MSDSINLECVEDGASKFWSGTVKGNVLTTRWGKIGTKGQGKEETFADPVVASASLEKQVAAKIKKGYRTAGVARKSKTAPATGGAKASASAKKPAARQSSKKVKPGRILKASVAGATAPLAKISLANASPGKPKAVKLVVSKAKTGLGASIIPTTKPQLTTWLKNVARTSSELAAAAGRFPETDRMIAAHTSTPPAPPRQDSCRVS